MSVEEPAGVGAGGPERDEGGGETGVEDSRTREEPCGRVDAVGEEGREQQGAARADEGEQAAEQGGEVTDVRGHFAGSPAFPTFASSAAAASMAWVKTAMGWAPARGRPLTRKDGVDVAPMPYA